MVEEFVRNSLRILEEKPDMSEEATKYRLVNQFIDLIEWDVSSTEVEPEYAISMGTGTKNVDFSLNIDREPEVLVEVKPSKIDLKKKHEDQLKSYMRQEIEVKWGILTNGRKYKIYKKNKNNYESEVIAFTLTDLQDNPNIINIIKKENIKNGKSEEIASELIRIQEDKNQLKTNKENITKDTVETLRDYIQTNHIDIEKSVENFIDNIIKNLDDAIDFESFDQDDSIQEKSNVQEEQVTIKHNNQIVKEINGNSQKEVYVGAVEFLIDNYDLMGKVKPLPHVPENRKKAIINDDPVSPHSGEKMKAYEKLENGYYLDCNLSKSDKQDVLNHLSNHVEVEVEY